MAPNVLLFGSGAIGTIYVYLLQKAGCDVTAVCRSNYEAAKSNGFLIDSVKYGKGIRIQPNVVRTVGEAASRGPFDYVIVTAKALPKARLAETIAPAVTKTKTLIALIQNGINIEQDYALRFPENPVLSCVVYLPTTQVGPGHIEMGAVERLEVGTYPASAYKINPVTKLAADQFVELLRQGGSQIKLYDDIQERRWNKLLLNASWNPICALTLCRDVAFLDSSPAAEQLVSDVMLEVVSISQKLGYNKITASTARAQLERANGERGGKGIEPSMLVDVLNGRRMEADVILGNTIQVAKQHGVQVPRMETLYALMKALEAAVTLRKPGRSLGGDETRTTREQKGLL